jgi:hypothetical protein
MIAVRKFTRRVAVVAFAACAFIAGGLELAARTTTSSVAQEPATAQTPSTTTTTTTPSSAPIATSQAPVAQSGGS